MKNDDDGHDSKDMYQTSHIFAVVYVKCFINYYIECHVAFLTQIRHD